MSSLRAETTRIGYFEFLAHGLDDVVAAGSGKHEVDDENVVAPGEGGRERSGSVGFDIGGVSVQFQEIALELGDVEVVLGDQYVFHGLSPCQESGMEIVNSRPPSGTFAAAIVPPCASTSSFAMARPRPVLPRSFVRSASTR